MAGDQEVEAMGKIAEALGAVADEEARVRILRWAQAKYVSEGLREPAVSLGDRNPPAAASGVGPRAARWLNQTGLGSSQLDEVFHFDGSGTSVIASNVPGKNANEQVINCYLLEGIRSFLASDEPTISDSAARALCRSAGCYDPSNHSKRVGKFENRITGDAARGWVVTGPGLAAAAALIKEMTTPS
ncbi:MAG TPA: hypothetical protein VD997_08290 [Phycisphaerales bacterium]|nr:hypothetical protein [Phycisphaerales bacterium]